MSANTQSETSLTGKILSHLDAEKQKVKLGEKQMPEPFADFARSRQELNVDVAIANEKDRLDSTKSLLHEKMWERADHIFLEAYRSHFPSASKQELITDYENFLREYGNKVEVVTKENIFAYFRNLSEAKLHNVLVDDILVDRRS